jgi:glyoxylase-like metal-dependent hydrolase (beta-lactamase superfamily II)
MDIKTFFDPRTYTFTYVVYDAETKDAVVIDPVLDYEPVGSKVYCESVEEVSAWIKANGLNLHYILETHAHADHLSGSQNLKLRFPNAKTGIGAQITMVQKLFKSVFGLPRTFAVDGSQFDVLLREGEPLQAGSLTFNIIPTPGHTPACVSLQIEDAVFTGDVIFMPDQGTGRCDFPAGSATDMYASVQKLYALPDETRLFVGHDYQPGGREVAWVATVAEQKANNIRLAGDTSEEDFVTGREARDMSLNAPKLLYQSVQINIAAGHLPDVEGETRYLKIPVNVFRPEPSNLHLDDV